MNNLTSASTQIIRPIKFQIQNLHLQVQRTTKKSRDISVAKYIYVYRIKKKENVAERFKLATTQSCFNPSKNNDF